MITLRSESFIKHSPEPNEKISIIRAEIDVDTRDELPEIDGISGRILHQGSTALIITEGKIAVLGGDGKWYINGEAIK
ncbi:MAG: hypothetical protein K2O60_06470 [Ruminococcus sp.]|nr:hypothetical protein [Ruminococcus sp.]